MLSVPSLGRNGAEKISNARPDASGFFRFFGCRALLSFYALGNRILLTPCFSGVFSEGKARQPLERFRLSDTGKHPAKAGC
jgi:hypothetical protein